jgi:hypothetical protein
MEKQAMASDELTERELRVLEHLKKAKALEVTIAEYARGFEVDAGELYQIRQKLIRKGAIEGPVRASKEAPPGDFMSVLISPSNAAPPPPSVAVCRIRHPSGLEIECTDFPPASWLTALLPGATDVPA